MARVGKTRYIDFRIVDSNNTPITGLTLGSFTRYFTRDGTTCADVISLTDKGSGRYLATYVPSTAGFDFLELYSSLYDIRVQDAELVDSDATFFDIGSASVDLTQDYNGVGRLKVVASSPANFVLYVFRSQDWQSGRTDPEYALKATAIDAFGNWVSSPLTVLKDTYHIVAVSTDGSINVISPFLQVQ